MNLFTILLPIAAFLFVLRSAYRIRMLVSNIRIEKHLKKLSSKENDQNVQPKS